MRHNIQHFSRRLDGYVDSVSRLSKSFCDQLGITLFGFVRVTTSGNLSWVTSNPEQDQFLLESHSLCEDPLFDCPERMKDGQYLWFHDRQFAGCEEFYRDRVKHFSLDHGMVLVRHGKNYVDMCCFSGLLSKRPLYNLFMNDQLLFQTFMNHFTSSLDRRLLSHMQEGIPLADIKQGMHAVTHTPTIDRAVIAEACGCKNFMHLSSQEKKCLLHLKACHTYQGIADTLGLSARTVEHYLDSVKNKLGLTSRPELYLASEKLSALGIV